MSDLKFGPQRQGTCGRCGKRCTYMAFGNFAFWVHDDNGDFRSSEPEPHDCNTFIERDKDEADARD